MKRDWIKTCSKMLAGLFVLALLVSSTSPAQAEREIWLEPAEKGKKGPGNWGTVKMKKDVHFSWHIPADFDDDSGQAFVVVFGRKDQFLQLTVDVNVVRDGEPHDMMANSIALPDVKVFKNHLTEIDVSSVLPGGLVLSDYVTLRLGKASKKSKFRVVGMRYVYQEANTNTNAASVCANGFFLNGDGSCDSADQISDNRTISHESLKFLSNTGGVFQENLDIGSSTNRFCALVGVDVEDTDTPGERAVCRVHIHAGRWVLEAVLFEPSNDANVRCQAQCFTLQ